MAFFIHRNELYLSIGSRNSNHIHQKIRDSSLRTIDIPTMNSSPPDPEEQLLQNGNEQEKGEEEQYPLRSSSTTTTASATGHNEEEESSTTSLFNSGARESNGDHATPRDDDVCRKDAARTTVFANGRNEDEALPRVIPTAVAESPGQRKRQLHQQQQRVRFGTVEIREYPMTLGANPATQIGAPVCLEWEHITVRTAALEDEDEENQRRREDRQRGRQRRPATFYFYLNYYQRRAILEREGRDPRAGTHAILGFRK